MELSNPEVVAETVTADFNYVDAGAIAAPLHFSLDHAWSGIPTVQRSVPVTDASSLAEPPRFDREGFQLVQTGVSDIDWLDEELIGTVWRDAALAAVKQLTGADDVVGWGIGLRYSERNLGAKRTDVTNPARKVHGDFSPTHFGEKLDHWDAEQRVAEVANGRRLAHWIGINVWQPVSPAPYDNPLAVCDARSVRDEDVLIGRGSVPSNRSIEVDLLLYYDNPDYRWHYFSKAEPGEALVFCGIEAKPRGGWRTVPHSAFDNPACPEASVPRMSVEMRALALFYEE